MTKGLDTGINFGIASGVITTLGLIVGLHAGTSSLAAVVGGVLTIAVADSCSDALGIHVAKEGEADVQPREVWMATIATFFTKCSVSLTFLVPLLVFSPQTMIIASVVWGVFLLAGLSFYLARQAGDNPFYATAEHLSIAILVIVVTHWMGRLVAFYFPA